jgi:hypothetical protein
LDHLSMPGPLIVVRGCSLLIAEVWIRLSPLKQEG